MAGGQRLVVTLAPELRLIGCGFAVEFLQVLHQFGLPDAQESEAIAQLFDEQHVPAAGTAAFEHNWVLGWRAAKRLVRDSPKGGASE